MRGRGGWGHGHSDDWAGRIGVRHCAGESALAVQVYISVCECSTPTGNRLELMLLVLAFARSRSGTARAAADVTVCADGLDTFLLTTFPAMKVSTSS